VDSTWWGRDQVKYKVEGQAQLDMDISKHLFVHIPPYTLDINSHGGHGYGIQQRRLQNLRKCQDHMSGTIRLLIQMLFNFNTIDACFLSTGWQIKNNGMFAATCIGTILLVVLVEFCRRIGREYDNFLTRQFQRQAAHGTLAKTWSSRRAITFRATPLQQLTRSVIHAVTFAGAYITMLLAMYFNVYVIICIFIGAGLGKFLCDWMVVTVGLDDMQDKTRKLEETTICCD
jgi:copper transporter 1